LLSLKFLATKFPLASKLEVIVTVPLKSLFPPIFWVFVADNKPLVVSVASGKLKLCMAVLLILPDPSVLVTVKSVPVVVVVNICEAAEIVFKVNIPLLPQLGTPEFTVNTCPVLPTVNLLKVLAALA